MPPGIVATLPEWYVYWWCLNEDYVEGVDFQFQSSIFGGRVDKGGLVLDFLFPRLHLPEGRVVNVDGFVWHRYAIEDRANDVANDVRLIDQGFDIVHVAEEDVLKRLDYTMSQAVKGIQLFPKLIGT